MYQLQKRVIGYDSRFAKWFSALGEYVEASLAGHRPARWFRWWDTEELAGVAEGCRGAKAWTRSADVINALADQALSESRTSCGSQVFHYHTRPDPLSVADAARRRRRREEEPDEVYDAS
jgi:hypothetical protein